MEDGQLLLDEQKDVEILIDQLWHQGRKLAEEFHREPLAVTQNSSTLVGGFMQSSRPDRQT